jgi:hypothetical protein
MSVPVSNRCRHAAIAWCLEGQSLPGTRQRNKQHHAIVPVARANCDDLTCIIDVERVDDFPGAIGSQFIQIEHPSARKEKPVVMGVIACERRTDDIAVGANPPGGTERTERVYGSRRPRSSSERMIFQGRPAGPSRSVRRSCD